jgi:hypothetical protein
MRWGDGEGKSGRYNEEEMGIDGKRKRVKELLWWWWMHEWSAACSKETA